MILFLHPTILTFLENVLLNSRSAPLLNSVWMLKYSFWKVKSWTSVSHLFKFVWRYKCLECNQFKLPVWIKSLNQSFQLIKSDKSNLMPRNNFREIWNQFSIFWISCLATGFLPFMIKWDLTFLKTLPIRKITALLCYLGKERRILKLHSCYKWISNIVLIIMIPFRRGFTYLSHSIL